MSILISSKAFVEALRKDGEQGMLSISEYPYNHRFLYEGHVSNYLADLFEKSYSGIEDLTELLKGWRDSIIAHAITTLVHSNEGWVRPYRTRWLKSGNSVRGDQPELVDPTMVSSRTSAPVLSQNDSLVDMLDTALVDAFNNLHRHRTGFIKTKRHSMLNSEKALLNLYFSRFLHGRFTGSHMHRTFSALSVKPLTCFYGKTQLVVSREHLDRLAFRFLRITEQEDKVEELGFWVKQEEGCGAFIKYGFDTCNTDVIAALQMIQEMSNSWHLNLHIKEEEEV